MAFSKREKMSIIALACLLVVVGVIYGGNRIFAEQQQERLEEEQAAFRKQTKAGEFLRLDSNEDKNDQLADGSPYSVGLGWDGVMELRVNDAALVSGSAGVERELGSLPWWAKNLVVDCNYLIVRYTAHNIDADPVFTNRAGVPLFLLNLKVSPGGVVCFDGTYNGEQAPEQEMLYYELPKGEQRDYTVIYKFYKDDDVNNLYLYVGDSLSDKYTIHPDIRDLRE